MKNLDSEKPKILTIEQIRNSEVCLFSGINAFMDLAKIENLLNKDANQ
ncbi:MAG: hypothetical protein HKM06_08505 [Spirochaetales bacterium]|nr:hypothetical protein [Spirochaetales bacterium]